MEFIDGSEVTPAHGTLAALKRDRIAQRLLANFGLTDVQRSLDGAQYVFDTPKLNITAVAARPTEGVFQVNGWDELKINVFYGAVTGQHGKYAATDWRVFALGYSDYRSGVVKTDNRAGRDQKCRLPTRSTSARTAAMSSRLCRPAAGPVDLLFWGALQSGSWGTQTQRAGAFAAEAGWQPARAEADQAVDSRRLRLRIGRRQRGRRHARARSSRCCRRRAFTRARRSTT